MKSFEDQKMWYALYVCDAIYSVDIMHWPSS